MSYSRPDETWGYEPREAARAPDDPAWGGQEPPAEPPGRPRRRIPLLRRSPRGGKEAPPAAGEAEPHEPGGDERGAEDETADDHTMPPATPHPLHRLPPLAVTFVISAGIILGAQLERPAYAAGIAVLQIATLVCAVWTRRVEGAWVTLAAGTALALAADWAAVAWTPVSLLPITVLLAAAFQAAAFGQLLRRNHSGVIESFGFTMILCIAMCGYSCYIALSRLGAAPPAMYSAVVAAGTAILAARAVDLVMPDPRINRQVTRGAFGIVIGTMCGTASAAYAGLVIEGPEPRQAAIGGLLVALTAVLVDLACGYMSAARRIDGEGTAPQPVINIAGPLLAFALAGPVVYLLSAYYIID
ncbi:hypothetical protein [Glycomyces tenuis]|uniref:hypothetical protein n=1 Tax=Glycomyces tenuis TaxID=58116 RepID=UPI0004143342|nr:hypothetical protein [Glycomyces tenuis]